MDRTSEAILKTEDLELRVGKLERAAAESGGGGGEAVPVLCIAAPSIMIGTSSFGNIKTDGNIVVMVTFSGESTSLRFNGTKVITGTSPLVAVINGQGKLDLSNIRNGSKAIIIGNCTQV